MHDPTPDFPLLFWLSSTGRHLVAAGTVAEAAAALDRLGLGDGDDVDGDGVELLGGQLDKLNPYHGFMRAKGKKPVMVGCDSEEKLTPRCLRRSLVSVSTSS